MKNKLLYLFIISAVVLCSSSDYHQSGFHDINGYDSIIQI